MQYRFERGTRDEGERVQNELVEIRQRGGERECSSGEVDERSVSYPPLLAFCGDWQPTQSTRTVSIQNPSVKNPLPAIVCVVQTEPRFVNGISVRSVRERPHGCIQRSTLFQQSTRSSSLCRAKILLFLSSFPFPFRSAFMAEPQVTIVGSHGGHSDHLREAMLIQKALNRFNAGSSRILKVRAMFFGKFPLQPITM